MTDLDNPNPTEASPTARPEPARWLLLLLPLAAVALYFGWHRLFFLCDDAFIAFRYILNRRLGYGYVWNPPPFMPVEGYTSFLWVVLCDLLWTITGYAPPFTAGFLGLACAFGTVCTTTWMAWVVPLSERLERWRPLGVALVLLGLLSNRTFLVWTSSGLETPLFIFLHVAWVGWATLGERGPRWLTVGAWLSVLMSLTRPDGLLYYAACPAVVGAAWLGGRPFSRRDAWAAVPVALFFAHLTWRWFTYHDLLPNTYYAKVDEPWLEGGGNHFWLYVLDNGWFWWIPVALGALWTGRRSWASREAWVAAGPLWIAIGTLVVHVAYYVYKVGGDHFEFRIYAHAPALIFVGTLAALSRMGFGVRSLVPTMLALTSMTWIVAWQDWAQLKDEDTPDAPKLRYRAITPLLPSVFKAWGQTHDELEKYCVGHVLGLPWQTHKWFRIHNARRLPKQDEILKRFGPDDWLPGAKGKDAFPITSLAAVGVGAWEMPYVAILDKFGLGDKIIALNTPDPDRKRYSAHHRFPPPGYIDCFKPSLTVLDEYKVRGRVGSFGIEDIVQCEQRYLKAVQNGETDAWRWWKKRPAQAVKEALDAVGADLAGEAPVEGASADDAQPPVAAPERPDPPPASTEAPATAPAAAP